MAANLPVRELAGEPGLERELAELSAAVGPGLVEDWRRIASAEAGRQL
jgi:hypothetical protein